MDPESAHNCLMRPLCRPSKASDAQPQLRHGSSYQEPSHSERQRRHSLDSGTQPRQLHRSSYQEPFNSEQKRRHSLEIGMTPRHQHRRSYQGFHSDVQRKDSLKIVSEERKKAAAWAWYQHGGVVAPTKRVIERRHGSTREDRRNRPASRFKTEAMKNSGSALNTSGNSVWDCESNLYDSFEFQSFSEQLHRALQGVPISACQLMCRMTLCMKPLTDTDTTKKATALWLSLKKSPGSRLLGGHSRSSPGQFKRSPDQSIQQTKRVLKNAIATITITFTIIFTMFSITITGRRKLHEKRKLQFRRHRQGRL